MSTDEQFSPNPEEPPIPEQATEETESYEWTQGFLDIFTNPTEISRYRVESPWSVISLSVLIYTLAIVVLSFFTASNEAIRTQSYEMQTSAIRKMIDNGKVKAADAEKIMEGMQEGLNFSLPKSLGIGVVWGFISMMIVGSVFWVFVRMFIGEPPPFSAITALVGYGYTISSLGIIITGLMQYFGSSLAVAPNLGAIVNWQAHPSMFAFLSRVDIFSIWEFLVTGIVVAAHVGFTRSRGMILGTSAFLLSLGFWGFMTWISSVFTG